ncbi:MAG: hypothetical protein QNK37_15505 [Acidobacteriota bacterium]|nr:hypothetical protein [Acidobacteriota bacterium]
MFRKTMKLTLFVFLVPAFVPGWAQKGNPVYIHFQFGEPQVARKFGDLAEKERDLSRQLAEICNRTIGYWHFQAGDSEQSPRLGVRLEDDNALWKMIMTLYMGGQSRELGQWRSDIFNPGEIDEYGPPGRRQWPDRVITCFQERLLADVADELREVLQVKVPLGSNPAPIQLEAEPAARALVLPLDSEAEGHEPLTTATFRVFYRGPGGPPITVHSQAACARFTFPGMSFQGILVRHTKYQRLGMPVEDLPDDLSFLADYSPAAFFLHGLDDYDSWQYCGVAIADSEVAP